MNRAKVSIALTMLGWFGWPGVGHTQQGAVASPASSSPQLPRPAGDAALSRSVPLEQAIADGKGLTEKQLARVHIFLKDWAQLSRYRDENAALPAAKPGEPRAVFLGDSITDAWGRSHGRFFPGKPYINRGISGQTTPQMLVRFQQDVLALKPAVVVILAGTNDVAENVGPETDRAIEDNFRSMVTLAKVNHVRVVLSSILPVSHYGWNPSLQNSAARIRTLNDWLRTFCIEEHLTYLDYYSALVNDEGGMRKDLTTDGWVHPNDAGYAVMEPLAADAIQHALRAK